MTIPPVKFVSRVLLGMIALAIFSPHSNAQEKRGRILDHRGEILALDLRSYPKLEFSHVLGYCQKRNDEVRGVTGLERAHNEQLAKGIALTTTLDARVQKICVEAFPKGKRGAVVVLDPSTGAIRATVSFPNYDPHVFFPVMNEPNWLQLTKDRNRPLVDRTLIPSPPGSTYKVLSMLAGLPDGHLEKKYTCTGGVPFGRKTLRCWADQHGELTASEALKHSCNSYFYRLSRDIGMEQLLETSRLLGMGRLTNTGLNGENRGWLPVEKDETYAALTSIGQGTLMTTPLQMAGLVATVANGGSIARPHLIPEDGTEELKTLQKEGYPQAGIVLLRSAMRAAVNAEDGTAAKARSEQVIISGKTGTAQVRVSSTRENLGNRAPNEAPIEVWKETTHRRSFIGFAPFEDPKYAIYVLVEANSEKAPDEAEHPAGVAKTILERLIELP